VDCKQRSLEWYGLGEPESAPPAIDVFGREVKVPTGTYRHIEGPKSLRENEMYQLCETDWTKERKESFAAAVRP
jgi:hypothetical protein